MASLTTFAFFYLWYGRPEFDEKWIHWNHSILPHWTESVRAEWASTAGISYLPPQDLHSSFYPLRGPYSSRDTTNLMTQFYEMKEYSIDAIIVSWWGRPDGSSSGDSQGVNTDSVIASVLETAFTTNMKVALHLEPYEGRCVESIRLDLEYLYKKYGKHPALARSKRPGTETELPMMFVYDSYHISSRLWSTLLSTPSGENNMLGIRGEPFDAFLIGLWLNNNDGHELAKGSFDGSYTYFATDGFSWGSTLSNWQHMSKFMYDRKMAFFPSVAPGYDDRKIRPWNAAATRDRANGDYYKRGWKAAIDAGVDQVTITSYNEWGESTQIEPAVPYSIEIGVFEPRGECLNQTTRKALRLPENGEYLNYKPEEPHYYLEITRDNVKVLKEKRPWKYTEVVPPGLDMKNEEL